MRDSHSTPDIATALLVIPHGRGHFGKITSIYSILAVQCGEQKVIHNVAYDFLSLRAASTPRDPARRVLRLYIGGACVTIGTICRRMS
jgi:hypothetical protein